MMERCVSWDGAKNTFEDDARVPHGGVENNRVPGCERPTLELHSHSGRARVFYKRYCGGEHASCAACILQRSVRSSAATVTHRRRRGFRDYQRVQEVGVNVV